VAVRSKFPLLLVKPVKSTPLVTEVTTQRIGVAEGGFQNGQTAKARSGRRVQSLPRDSATRRAFSVLTGVRHAAQ